MEPPSLDSPPLPPWERNLHSDASRSYPSNYVPPSLLALANASSISMHSPPPPRLAPLVRASLGISCALSCVAGFLAVFLGLRSETVEPADVIWGSVLLGGAGYMLDGGVLANDEGPRAKRRKPLRPTIVTLLLLHVLAPILRTLTEATATDSIWPLAGALLALGLILGDYDPAGKTQPSGKGLARSLSVTSTLSASVVLASRLATNTHVFALVLLAVVIFALAPPLLKRLRSVPLALALFTSASLALAMVTADEPTGRLFALGAFVAISVGVVLLAPAAMVWRWSEKSVIRGDWDVAAPVVRGEVWGAGQS